MFRLLLLKCAGHTTLILLIFQLNFYNCTNFRIFKLDVSFFITAPIHYILTQRRRKQVYHKWCYYFKIDINYKSVSNHKNNFLSVSLRATTIYVLEQPWVSRFSNTDLFERGTDRISSVSRRLLTNYISLLYNRYKIKFKLGPLHISF